MPLLKPSFIKDIQLSFQKSQFTMEDFVLDLPESGSLLARIAFAHKPEYILSVHEEEKQERVITEEKYSYISRTEVVRETILSVKTVPGIFKTKEIKEIYELSEVLAIIPKWCDSIRADLYALMPTSDPVEELRQQWRSKLDELVDDPTSYFSQDELVVVDERFDQLYEEITTLREQYSVTKQQLEEMRRDFDEFKRSARAYPKGMWSKITSNKLLKGTVQVINSPEGRTFLFQTFRRALGFPDGQ